MDEPLLRPKEISSNRPRFPLTLGVGASKRDGLYIVAYCMAVG